MADDAGEARPMDILFEDIQFTKHKLSAREKLEVLRVITERRIRMAMRFRISAFFTLVGILVSIGVWFFMAIIVQDGVQSYIMQYGDGNYFAYALIGIAFTAYAGIALSIYLTVIRATYWGNLLEMILSSPMKFTTFLLSTLLWAFLVATVNILLYIILGVGLFGAPVPFPNDLLLVIVVLVIAIVAISGLGLMSASMFMLADVKGETEPISWAVTTLAGLVSGTMFPPELFLDVFPPLYAVSRIMPHTYALDAMRRVILSGEGWSSSMVQQDILVLLLFSAILLPWGLLLFKYGIKKGEKDGQLARWG